MSDRVSAFNTSVVSTSSSSNKLTVSGDVVPLNSSLQSGFKGTLETASNPSSSAALSVINTKLAELQRVGTSTVSVKLGNLLGEVAPGAISIFSLGPFLVNGIDRLTKVLLGNTADPTVAAAPGFKEIPAEIVEKLTGSRGVSTTLAGFSTIRNYASSANVFSGTLKVAGAIMKVIEALLPIAEITADLALTLWSCGTSTAKAGAELTEVIEDLCQRLLSLALEALRKFIFGLKIDVPSYLVGSLGTMSLYEVMNRGINDAWLKDVFDEEFFRTALTSDTWETSIAQALKNIQPNVEDIPYNYTKTRGDLLKELFTAELVREFMIRSTKIAREKAQLVNYDNLDWSYYDEVILRTKTPKENSSYSLLDGLLVRNLQESPLTDEESIILVSGTVLEKMS